MDGQRQAGDVIHNFHKSFHDFNQKKKKKTTDMKIKVKQKDMENKQGGLALIQ